MKTEHETTFQSEIKFLYKKFNVLDKPNTKILYEFCQFDAERTYKVLSIASTLRNPLCIIDYLIKNSEKSDDYIDALVKRYDLQINEPVELSMVKVETKKVSKEIIKLDYDFFENVPCDTIGTIMSYLDPYSLKLFTFTSCTMHKIGKAQALSQLYKQISKVLFSTSEPTLPFICRFGSVRKFVLEHPDQYFPYWNNFKNAVTNNLRSYIWRIEPTDLKLGNGYYKEFGSYENLFMKCPRPNMNGFYMCKHKYVKIGQKNATQFITPIIIIYYFRYLRFMEDGTVIYYVCNKKIKPEEVLKFLGKNCLVEQQHPAIIGEYMQHKSTLHIKAVKNDSVFCYDLEINSNDNKICNQLKVINYRLQLIDKSYMSQTLFAANPHKEDLIFDYYYNEDIKAENGPRIQACSWNSDDCVLFRDVFTVRFVDIFVWVKFFFNFLGRKKQKYVLMYELEISIAMVRVKTVVILVNPQLRETQGPIGYEEYQSQTMGRVKSVGLFI